MTPGYISLPRQKKFRHDNTIRGKDIEFSLRTFRFTNGQSSSSDQDQDQIISCVLHLGPVADVPEEQAADCYCHIADGCGKKFSFSKKDQKYLIFHFEISACGRLFPFRRGSEGSKSIIEYLHSNLNYQTRITADGKF